MEKKIKPVVSSYISVLMKGIEIDTKLLKDERVIAFCRRFPDLNVVAWRRGAAVEELKMKIREIFEACKNDISKIDFIFENCFCENPYRRNMIVFQKQNF